MAMGADTVSLARGRRRVTLPRLAIVRRGTWREQLAGAALVSALVAGAAYCHHQWRSAEERHVAYLAAQALERDQLTEVIVRSDGVECRTPPVSEQWVRIVSDLCRSLGIAHRDLFNRGRP